MSAALGVLSQLRTYVYADEAEGCNIPKSEGSRTLFKTKASPPFSPSRGSRGCSNDFLNNVLTVLSRLGVKYRQAMSSDQHCAILKSVLIAFCQRFTSSAATFRTTLNVSCRNSKCDLQSDVPTYLPVPVRVSGEEVADEPRQQMVEAGRLVEPAGRTLPSRLRLGSGRRRRRRRRGTGQPRRRSKPGHGPRTLHYLLLSDRELGFTCSKINA